MRVTILLLAAALALGARCDGNRPLEPGQPVTVRGTLTDEGVECPALRDRKGVLFTLAGGLGGFKPGDEVCVRGRVAEMSFCMQGVTIAVEWIGPGSECR